MKITREELQDLIVEEIQQSKSILLEMPMGATSGSKMGALDPDSGYDTDLDTERDGKACRSNLFHLSAQAQQLHDLLSDDEKLDLEIESAVKKAAASIEQVFKLITYQRHNPKGQ
tara:strand:- start:557 stop:901 length:345 start_codon:yes stop_codon:yes gene_type:complete